MPEKSKSGRHGRKPRTARQAKLLQGVMHGKTVAQAAIEAGYTTHRPEQAGYQALKVMRRSLGELLDSAGLTERAAIDKYLLPALEATEVKVFNHNGKLKYSRPLKAWAAKLNALDIYYKLRGSYISPAEATHAPPVQVILVDVPRPDRSAFVSKPAIAVDPSGNGNNPSN
jgi:hypothetical protein